MGAADNARDWEVASVADVGVGAGLAAGYFTFVFRSREANYGALYGFLGGGLGAGGRGGNVTVPDVTVERGQSPLSFTSINCVRIFSGNDLDGCWGRLSTAGAGAIAGYGATSITAGNLGGMLFNSQNVNGTSISLGASAMTTMGAWARLDESPSMNWNR